MSGKGDHKHIGSVEVPYSFTHVDALVADFIKDIEGLTDIEEDDL